MRLGVSPTATSTPTGVFSQSFEALFPCTGTLGCTVYLVPQLFLPVYLYSSVGPPHWVCQPQPFCKSSSPSCLSLPLLPVWMNVFSLTPWLWDFHTVRFSVSSGCFLFLNLLLTFFWLCEGAQCVYLRPNLGQKSKINHLKVSNSMVFSAFSALCNHHVC